MSLGFVRSIVVFIACAALGASGCSSAGGSAKSAESSSGGTSGPRSSGQSGSAGNGKLAPRYDLHCTPQAEGDEAACLAKGSDHHFGPPLICRGVQAPPDVEEEERRAYEQATSPCTCISSEDERQCAMVP